MSGPALSVAPVISVQSKAQRSAWSARPANLVPRRGRPPVLSVLPANTSPRQHRKSALRAHFVVQDRTPSIVAVRATVLVSRAPLAGISRCLAMAAWIVPRACIRTNASRLAAVTAALAGGRVSVAACLAMHVTPVNISQRRAQRAKMRARNARK